jgi:hypothetical protein
MRRRQVIHQSEIQRHQRQRAAARPALLLDVQPLLYTRAQTARLLNVSIATVQRLQKAGRLTPIKLNKQSPGMTHYRSAQVHALASGGDDAR